MIKDPCLNSNLNQRTFYDKPLIFDGVKALQSIRSYAIVNSYELMLILRPDLNEERVSQEVNKYQDLLRENNAADVSVKIWGKRRLAYQIRRFNDGIYALFHFQADGKQIALVERDMRLNDNVMRFLSLKLTPEKPAKETEKELVEA